MALDNPEDLPVPRFSAECENICNNYLAGVLDSSDFDFKGQLNLAPRAAPRPLPFQRQEMPTPRPPLAPVGGGAAADAQRDVGLLALAHEVALQEADAVATAAELKRLRRQVALLENLVGSFCNAWSLYHARGII